MSDKTWRPENPYTKMLPAAITYERDRKLTAEERIFEEGVDATLEALRESGQKVNISDRIRFFRGNQEFTLVHPSSTTPYCTLVVIPDDESEEVE